MRDITALVAGSSVPVSLSPLLAGGGGGAGAGGLLTGEGAAGGRTKSAVRDEGRRQPPIPEFYPVVRRPAREARQSSLTDRAWRRDTGLSNPAYLAASSETQFLRVQIEPARVKFTFSDPVAEHLTPLRSPGGRRGVISELSDSARDRLANRAWALTAEGHEPEAMVTLTSPANWREVYAAEGVSGGRLLKGHLEAFRKRMGRFLEGHGISSWSALWFLEFQRRGAPHIHLLVFGCKLPELVRRALRGWCGRAWSSIVGNPDPVERGKHQRAGTQVARMRAKHFGYAVKYATKTEQKTVPDDFRDVGRFWGCWNYKGTAPVLLDVDYSRLNDDEAGWVRRLLSAALVTVYPSSPSFVTSRLNKVEAALAQGLRHKFGFTVFGAAAGQVSLSLLA